MIRTYTGNKFLKILTKDDKMATPRGLTIEQVDKDNNKKDEDDKDPPASGEDVTQKRLLQYFQTVKANPSKRIKREEETDLPDFKWEWETILKFIKPRELRPLKMKIWKELGKPGKLKDFNPFKDRKTKTDKEIYCYLDLKEDYHGEKRKYNRRMSREMKEWTRSKIKELESEGIIKKQMSDWITPLNIVYCHNKKNYRMTLDYRHINNATHKDCYPIPTMLELLKRIPKNHFKTKIDLKNGYWNVNMYPEHRKYTAFEFEGKTYVWNKMPQGLSNGPAVFHRFMDNKMSKFKDKCIVYFDDIIIWGKTKKECIDNTNEIKNFLEKEKLKINKEKSDLDPKEEIQALGYTITKNGLTMPKDRIDWFLQKKHITNKKEIRQILGKIQHYRKMYPSINNKLRFLYKLLEKEESEIKKEAKKKYGRFMKLKEILNKPIELQSDEENLSLITDASMYGLGAILKSENGTVDTMSIQVEEKDLKEPIFVKEMIAIKEALKRFNYVVKKGITIKTDSQTVISKIQNDKEEDPKIAKLVRIIKDYEPKLEYIRSELNPADEKSRSPPENREYENYRRKPILETQEHKDGPHNPCKVGKWNSIPEYVQAPWPRAEITCQ